MVREYDSTEPLDLILVVEAWLPTNASLPDHDRLEAAISLAASVFWAWCHGEESPVVTLVLLDRSCDSRTGRGGDWFAREALSLLSAAAGTSDTRARRAGRASKAIQPVRPDPGQQPARHTDRRGPSRPDRRAIRPASPHG